MDIDIAKYRTPGQLIAGLLESKGWTKRVLAIVLGVDETILNRVVSDKRVISPEMAILLEEAFEVPAEHFLNAQTAYELAKARIAVLPDPGRAIRARLFGGLPIPEMIKRGWLNAEDVRDTVAVEASLKQFFEVGSTDDLLLVPHAAKKTNTFSPVTGTQLAWVRRVRTIAQEMLVSRYSEATGRRAVTQLRDLLGSSDEARRAPRILAENGIRFVIVEALSGSKIDGVCTWLNDDSPVIGMSMRHDRIDNFWFVLRHEIEHVLRGDGRLTPVLDVDLQGDTAGQDSGVSEQERIANDAATEFCVPAKKMAAFIARKSPFFAERDIVGFANTLGVHPGIVAGQLQRATQRYDRFRGHLVKMRSIVAPSAFVDGWGDVAPIGQN